MSKNMTAAITNWQITLKCHNGLPKH